METSVGNTYEGERMDVVGRMRTISGSGKYLILTLFAANMFSVSFASAGNIATALASLCKTSQSFLGIAIMLLVILAGATYAIGQILGAETRARATVWATAMLTGAIIGALIYVVLPPVVVSLTGEPLSCTAGGQGQTCDEGECFRSCDAQQCQYGTCENNACVCYNCG
jgi:hypothetical protein